MSDYRLCSKCKEERDLSLYCKDKTKKDGLHPHCKFCRSEKSKRYYRLNKEKCLDKNRAWTKKNKEYHRKLILENARKLRKENPDHWREYYNSHKKEYAARSAKRRAQKLKATPLWADLDLVKHYYRVARCLQMEVDHIVPLQSKKVCGLHCIENMQLLTTEENRSKSNRLLED